MNILKKGKIPFECICLGIVLCFIGSILTHFKEPKISSSGISTKGGIDLNPTELDMKTSSSAFGFDKVSFETIKALRISSGLTFKILKIQDDVRIESILGMEEDELSYLPQ